MSINLLGLGDYHLGHSVATTLNAMQYRISGVLTKKVLLLADLAQDDGFLQESFHNIFGEQRSRKWGFVEIIDLLFD